LPNRVAFFLALALAAAIAADLALTGGETLVFLGRKFLALLEQVAFWR